MGGFCLKHPRDGFARPGDARLPGCVPGDAFGYPAQSGQEVPLLFGGGEHVVIGLLVGVEQAVDGPSIIARGAAYRAIHGPAEGGQTVDFLQGHGIEVEIAVGVVQPVDGSTLLGGAPGHAVQGPARLQKAIFLRFIGNQQMLVGVGIVQAVDGNRFCLLLLNDTLIAADIAGGILLSLS